MRYDTGIGHSVVVIGGRGVSGKVDGALDGALVEVIPIMIS